MALRKQDISPAKLEYYYDTHPTQEDLMGDSLPQMNLFIYLLDVLRWLYRKESWLVAGNINIYASPNLLEYPLAPDVAVFKVRLTEQEQQLRSWKMLEANRPAPSVVFEIGSESTFLDDIRTKPDKYGKLGVREYFAYDPHEPRLWRKYGGRLLGWRYTDEGEAAPIEPDEQGRIWSEELESWLVADGGYLRLYDRAGAMRLTKGEAEEAEKQMERDGRLAEYQRAEREHAEKEAEYQRAERERAEKEAAWAKLRELGIDPEKL